MSATKKHSPNTVLVSIGAGALLIVIVFIILWSVVEGPNLLADKSAAVVERPETTPTTMPTPTATPEPTAAPIPMATATPTAKPTATMMPTAMPTIELTAEPTPEPTATPIPIPTNFIVADEIWESATFLLWTDGKLYKNAIFFLDIPVETKLYAPIGGYLHEISLKEHGGEGAYYHGLVIGEAARWADSGPVGRYVILTAKEFNLLDIGSKNGNLFVEKGQPFAEVSNSAELHPDIYEQGPQLIMSFSKEWADMIDDSLITDPREYVWIAVQTLEANK